MATSTKIRKRVTFEGQILREALTEYLRNRRHDVSGCVEVRIIKLGGPGINDKGCVVLEWNGPAVEQPNAGKVRS